MKGLLTALLATGAALFGALFAYLGIRRQTAETRRQASGTISSTDAKTLWDESQDMRKELRAYAATLNEELESTRTEAARLRDEVKTLRVELANVRAEAEELRLEMHQLRVENEHLKKSRGRK